MDKKEEGQGMEQTAGQTEKQAAGQTAGRRKGSFADYIRKYADGKDKELKYDFMPKILEIIEHPANKAGAVIIWGIFTLLIAAVVWACLSKIDVVVVSDGNVQPVGNLNVVQANMEGTVIGINVSEGAYVEEGEILLELDTQGLDIDAVRLEKQKRILELQQETYTKLIRGENGVFDNMAHYDAELRNCMQVIRDADISYKNSLANLELQKSNAELNRQIAEVRLEQYRISGTQKQRQEQELVIEQSALAVEQLDLQLGDAKIQYSAQLHTRLAEIGSQMDEIEASLAKYELSKESRQLVAPVSGYVNSIDVNTVGETVAAGQDLITIVPADMPMEMVCYVKNMDIADVEVGMEAEIKLDAYPYNRFGTVKGQIKYVSPSAFVNEQMGSVYLVKLDIIDKSGNINLISGLSGSVEIKTGRRTIMQYFMEPIIRGLGESMKEK